MTENKRPRVNGESQRELDKIDDQFKDVQDQNKAINLDKLNAAPKQESEPQKKLSQHEIQNSKDIYLKPNRSLRSTDKFNESYRDDYNFAMEYVYFQAENKELIGEDITMWTKPFAGMPAEEWIVPVNKPVWGPRHLAEQIKKSNYRRLIMKDIPTNQVGGMQFYGAIGIDTTIQRLDAHPISQKKSVFMGNNEFSTKKIA